MATVSKGSAFFSTTGNSTNAVVTFLPEDVRGLVSAILDAANGWHLLITVLLTLVAYDQFMYIKQKGSIAGPTFKIPFMGPFIQSLSPKFDGYEAQWARGKLSCVSVFHKFVVLVSDRDLARKVFNSPQHVKPCLVDVAIQLFGADSWVFLNGKAHVDFRKGLSGLFTQKSLQTYLPTQDAVFQKFFDRFAALSEKNDGKPLPFMAEFRHFNAAVSCRTFVGKHLTDEEIFKISEDLYRMTAAMDLVNVPYSIYIPYTRGWRGKKGAEGVQAAFLKCATASRKYMAEGGEATCIVDRWISIMMESAEYNAAVAAGKTDAPKPAIVLREFTDFEIAQVLFTFLFASQDASSSATTWLFQIVAQRPEIMARIRQEALDIRNGDRHAGVSLEQIESMTYTNAVVKEILRYRPPVIFVPYVATSAFPITPDYIVPKGAMIIPSCYPALHDPAVYPQPDVFEPERWISGTAKDQTKNWLVFGTGPHQCLAQQYVPLALVGMIGKATLELDWMHCATPRSEEIKVFACLFPMDNCPLVFTKRP